MPDAEGAGHYLGVGPVAEVGEPGLAQDLGVTSTSARLAGTQVHAYEFPRD
jgi:hypothetical protein